MSRRRARRSQKPPRSDGIILVLERSERSAAQRSRLVRRLIGAHLPGEWSARRLGSRQTVDDRFELLRTSPAVPPTMRQAFRWTRRLASSPEVAGAETVPIQPGLEPPAESAVLPPSGLGMGDKACSQAPDWSVTMVRATEAWNLAPPRGGKQFGRGTIVAHPDTGYTLHPELASRSRLLAERGYDFEDERADPRDPLSGRFAGHGTATASVILSGVGPEPPSDGAFVTGIAPEARLIPYRVSDSVVHLSFRKLTRAIYGAIDAGAHVISMSLGGPFRQQYLEDAIVEATRRGVLVLAAAGNYYPFVVFPAAFDEVIAVAASNCMTKPWRFSASGQSVDLSAPGESVWRARARRAKPYDAARGSGTSFAVATAAGAAALWLSYHGRARLLRRYGRAQLAAAFHRVLLTSGVDRPRGWKTRRFGAGVLNVRKLLEAALPTESTLEKPRPSIGVDRSAGRPPSELQQMRHYYPGWSEGRLRRALVKLLSSSDQDLETLLARHGPELRFHVATQRSFRSFVVGAARPLPTDRTDAALPERFSSTLSSELAGILFARAHTRRK